MAGLTLLGQSLELNFLEAITRDIVVYEIISQVYRCV
jgi:hypothetical protein